MLAGARAWTPAAAALATAACGLSAGGTFGGANRLALEAHKKWCLVSAACRLSSSSSASSMTVSSSTTSSSSGSGGRTSLGNALTEASAHYQHLATAALSDKSSEWTTARSEAESTLVSDGNVSLADALSDVRMSRNVAKLARVYDRLPLTEVAAKLGLISSVQGGGGQAEARAALLVVAAAATWTDGRTGSVDAVARCAVFGDASVEEREAAAAAATTGLAKRVRDIAAAVASVRATEMAAVLPLLSQGIGRGGVVRVQARGQVSDY